MSSLNSVTPLIKGGHDNRADVVSSLVRGGEAERV
jgi:hypothetical protein